MAGTILSLLIHGLIVETVTSVEPTGRLIMAPSLPLIQPRSRMLSMLRQNILSIRGLETGGSR